MLSSLTYHRTDKVEDTACTASSRCVQHPASISARQKMGTTISNGDFTLANHSSLKLCTSCQKVTIWFSPLLES